MFKQAAVIGGIAPKGFYNYPTLKRGHGVLGTKTIEINQYLIRTTGNVTFLTFSSLSKLLPQHLAEMLEKINHHLLFEKAKFNKKELQAAMKEQKVSSLFDLDTKKITLNKPQSRHKLDEYGLSFVPIIENKKVDKVIVYQGRPEEFSERNAVLVLQFTPHLLEQNNRELKTTERETSLGVMWYDHGVNLLKAAKVSANKFNKLYLSTVLRVKLEAPQV